MRNSLVETTMDEIETCLLVFLLGLYVRHTYDRVGEPQNIMVIWLSLLFTIKFHVCVWVLKKGKEQQGKLFRHIISDDRRVDIFFNKETAEDRLVENVINVKNKELFVRENQLFVFFST